MCAIAITDYVMNVWRSIDSNESLSLSWADKALWDSVKKWADYASDRKDHRVSTRDLQIHKVGGVRHADKMRAVLMDYKKHYPGCVITEKNARGPETVWIYGPKWAGMLTMMARESVNDEG